MKILVLKGFVVINCIVSEKKVIRLNTFLRKVPSKRNSIVNTEKLHIEENVVMNKTSGEEKLLKDWVKKPIYTQEEFKKMGYKERIALYKSNPNEYERLAGR